VHRSFAVSENVVKVAQSDLLVGVHRSFAVSEKQDETHDDLTWSTTSPWRVNATDLLVLVAAKFISKERLQSVLLLNRSDRGVRPLEMSV
jgi:hypothetical protein